MYISSNNSDYMESINTKIIREMGLDPNKVIRFDNSNEIINLQHNQIGNEGCKHLQNETRCVSFY